jgi:hypothetical protein
MGRLEVRNGLSNPRKLAVLLALLMAGSLWFYVQRILIPYQQADAAARGRPRGILSDLYPRWVGTRELLLHGRDPYSAEVTREIQTGYYGRPLDPARPSDPKDQQRFAYPVYVVFLLAPTMGVSFSLLRIGFFWLLWILSAASVWLWLRVLRWKPERTLLMILIILTLSDFGVVQGSKLQQLSLLVGFLMAAGALLLMRGKLFLAGALFALATIKPQLTVLALAWLLLWTLGRWRERQGFVWGSGIALLLLTGGGEWILPGWIGRFMNGLGAYERYTGGGSLLDALVGNRAGTVLMILLLLVTVTTGWFLRKAALDSARFQLGLAFVFAIAVVVVPMTAPYNHVLLLPAILLIVRSWRSIWGAGGLTRIFCALAVLVFFWPWAAAFALTLASLALPAADVQRAWAVPLWTSLGIPLVILPLLAILFLRLREAGEFAFPDAPAISAAGSGRRA